MGGVDGGAGGGVHLGGVVQFDDFGGFEVFRGLGGKVVSQHGGDREIRCDEDLLGFGLRAVGDGGFDLGEFLVGPAGGADHHVHALADQGQHVVQTDGRHGEFDDHIGVVGGDLGQVVAGIQCERQLRILGLVHRFDHVRAHAALCSDHRNLDHVFFPVYPYLPGNVPGTFSNRQSAYHRQAVTPISRPQNQAPSDEPNREVELPLMSRTVKKTPEAFLGEGERQ